MHEVKRFDEFWNILVMIGTENSYERFSWLFQGTADPNSILETALYDKFFQHLKRITEALVFGLVWFGFIAYQPLWVI